MFQISQRYFSCAPLEPTLIIGKKFEKWFSNRSGSNGKRHPNLSPTLNRLKTDRRQKRAIPAKQLFADSKPGHFDSLAHQVVLEKSLPPGHFLSIRQELIGADWEMLSDHERSKWSSEANRLKSEQLALRELTPSPTDIDK